ncbi:MAG: MraY family glycosyltransferase [Chloroflexota bacterium]
MAPYLLMAASALILAVGGTPVIRQVAIRFGVLDRPASRKIHANPVPLLGGAAIYLAFIIALLFFGSRAYISELVGIFIGATLISLMGLVDDTWGLGSYVKLAGQAVAAGILILSGIQVQLFGGVFDIIITILWVTGITNALNLLDNMDGLSGGIAMIGAVFFTLLASMSDQYLVGILAGALAGACAGFLIHNWNPAHIFMGDTGSLFIGFLLSAVAIKLRFPLIEKNYSWLIPIFVMGLPIFDTTLVFISRLRRGKNPFTTPGKDHISHRLAFLLGSRREAVFICYLLAGVAGVAAVFVTQASFLEAFALAVVLLLTVLYGIWWLEFRHGGVRPS